jgi:hypothetical protein
MALVLCTGVEKALLQTRKLILEAAGHTVVTVTDEKTLAKACDEHCFDVAVIGQSTGPNSKRRLFNLIRQSCPEAKILELYPPHTGRILDNADSWLCVPVDIPQALADRVAELANGK